MKPKCNCLLVISFISLFSLSLSQAYNFTLNYLGSINFEKNEKDNIRYVLMELSAIPAEAENCLFSLEYNYPSSELLAFKYEFTKDKDSIPQKFSKVSYYLKETIDNGAGQKLTEHFKIPKTSNPSNLPYLALYVNLYGKGTLKSEEKEIDLIGKAKTIIIVVVVIVVVIILAITIVLIICCVKRRGRIQTRGVVPVTGGMGMQYGYPVGYSAGYNIGYPAGQAYMVNNPQMVNVQYAPVNQATSYNQGQAIPGQQQVNYAQPGMNSANSNSPAPMPSSVELGNEIYQKPQ